MTASESTTAGSRAPIEAVAARPEGMPSIAELGSVAGSLAQAGPVLDELLASAMVRPETIAANGENRWVAVAADTRCWPDGLSLTGDRLAVADSGNNRIMVWTVS